MESYGKKPPSKHAAKREPYYTFTHLGGRVFHDASPNTKESAANIGVETQNIPNRTTKGGPSQRVTDRAAKAQRRADKEGDGVDRITDSLVHDRRKGIEGTLSGGPVYFRSEQIRRLRGFNQAREPEVECDKIKHNAVRFDHDPFWQRWTPREKV